MCVRVRVSVCAHFVSFTAAVRTASFAPSAAASDKSWPALCARWCPLLWEAQWFPAGYTTFPSRRGRRKRLIPWGMERQEEENERES